MSNASVSLDSLASSQMDEETARADVYGLLAQLFYAPPPAELLAQLRAAPTDAPAAGAFLESSWRALVDSANALSDAQIHAEYDALFGGIGKPEIYLYGSHYLSGFLNEKSLIKLRNDLAELGLGRDEQMSDTEDHIAYECEVMRYLIAGDDVDVANLTQQRAFYATHLQAWIEPLCAALTTHPKASFYAALGAFTQAFMSVESQGFDILV